MLHCHSCIYRLVPNQIYHYVFGDDDFGWSSDHTFMAPPLVDQSSLTRVITYGGQLLVMQALFAAIS